MKVVITREASQGKETAKLFEEAGLQPILFPTIRFEELDFDRERLKKADIVVFSSQNSVKFLLDRIPLQLLEGKLIIATGEKTKKLLEKRGITGITTPQVYTGEYVAKLIKGLPDYKNKSCIVVRAKEGINNWIDSLSNDMDISILPVYQTVYNTPDNVDYVESLYREGKVDYTLFTSPSTFKGFKAVFPDNWREYLKKTKVAVIGTTTAKALGKEGVSPSIIPKKFTVEEVLKAIKQQASLPVKQGDNLPQG
ncbi:MAG: uroporphyrinogen-III synthase [Aquificae bacterium]|nr:uroporphyrinogen-III synthase [Aquificota bacterium]